MAIGFPNCGQYETTGPVTSTVEAGSGVVTITAGSGCSLKIWFMPVGEDPDRELALEEGARVVVTPNGNGTYAVSVLGPA